MIWLGRSRRKKADRLLSKGQVARAIALYEQEEAWEALVEAYQQQGELGSAAEAAKRARLYEQSAELLEQAGAFERAAQTWLHTSRKDRAALALERAGDFQRAAELYVETEQPARAAGALAELERFAEAAALYEQANQTENAVDMYLAANQHAEAARLLQSHGDLQRAARLYFEAGNKELAATLWKETNNPLQSARCYCELGNYKAAGELLESAERLFEAAEAYEQDEDCLEASAAIFCKVLRAEVAWQRDLNASAVCISVAEDGERLAVGSAAREVQLLSNTGSPLWRFKPTWGGRPCCVALSKDAHVVLGCDDKRLYFLDGDKTVLWTYELREEPVAVALSASGDRIACCTKGNVLLCFDVEGKLSWQIRFKSIIWDVAFSADGETLAIGTCEGSCVLLNADGRRRGQYASDSWVHSVSLSQDGSLVALGCGMRGVEFLDGTRLEAIWKAEDSSPVHDVALTARNMVLSVADEEALLRDETGDVIWRYAAKDRLMGGDIDSAERFAVFRSVGKKLERVNLLQCRDRAIANYQRAGSLQQAATLHEEMKDYRRAAELYRQAEDFLNAARNMEEAGQPAEAAELYELGGDFEKAADIFQQQQDLGKAAECFRKAGQVLRAAELLAQIGDELQAAELFGEAEHYGRAGVLYKSIGDKASAVSALQQHVALHPEDAEMHLELGLLLQEDGQYDAAIDELQKATADDAFRKRALMRVAECFVSKDLYEIAINRYQACLKEGEEVSADNLDVFYGLGRTFQLAGNHAEARRIFESILAINYQYSDVRERIEDLKTLLGVFGEETTVESGRGATMIVETPYQRLSSEDKERYTVEAQLGKGGMGAVYLAQDKRLKRTVALKILPPELADDEKLRLRMIREAQAVAQINHPNVVSVFDVGGERDNTYISMEYVEGSTVRKLLEEKGQLQPQECIELLLQVTEGLGYAHRKGIIHRDMKPENIMVATDGTAKIMDFGLALIQGVTRLTMPGAVSGTWSYMAPEQVGGREELGPPADVYALGCVAYELLTGSPPFTGDNAGIQHLSQIPTPLREIRPDIPSQLAAVVMKCLEKAPADRYPDASVLNEALREAQKAL